MHQQLELMEGRVAVVVIVVVVVVLGVDRVVARGAEISGKHLRASRRVSAS